ncbi:MAG TPA: PilZ domain-containing protein [Hyphomicrobiaceae bacterium]|nr:PilZ domain-containing protein [Hyphomicrobiaceae bacterium]
MTIHPTNTLNRATAQPVTLTSDRRRHKRVALALLGRFMRANRMEYPCKLQDISVGGGAILAPVPVTLNERIVAYFDHLGGVEGNVLRIFDGGFVMQFSATQHKREKIAAQLTFLINRDTVDGIEERRHERSIPKNSVSSLKLGDGVILPCQVMDVSISGASIGTEARPAVGTDVLLGKLRARVMRHHEHGIGVQFLDIQNPSALRKYFG